MCCCRTYDLERYRDTLRGFYFDFEATAPGPLLSTFAEVIAALRDIDAVQRSHRAAHDAFAARYCGLDDGRAAERVVRRLLAGRLRASSRLTARLKRADGSSGPARIPAAIASTAAGGARKRGLIVPACWRATTRRHRPQWKYCAPSVRTLARGSAEDLRQAHQRGHHPGPTGHPQRSRRDAYSLADRPSAHPHRNLRNSLTLS
jgi:hypothetical protein